MFVVAYYDLDINKRKFLRGELQLANMSMMSQKKIGF